MARSPEGRRERTAVDAAVGTAVVVAAVAAAEGASPVGQMVVGIEKAAPVDSPAAANVGYLGARAAVVPGPAETQIAPAEHALAYHLAGPTPREAAAAVVAAVAAAARRGDIVALQERPRRHSLAGAPVAAATPPSASADRTLERAYPAVAAAAADWCRCQPSLGKPRHESCRWWRAVTRAAPPMPSKPKGERSPPRRPDAWPHLEPAAQ